MKISFNTGRLYQANGQIITALFLPDQNVTLFRDHSRGIFGQIKGTPALLEPGPAARWVMREYDHYQYVIDHDALNLDPTDSIMEMRI